MGSPDKAVMAGRRKWILLGLLLLIGVNLELLFMLVLSRMPPSRRPGEAPRVKANLRHAFHFGTVDVTTNAEGLRSAEVTAPRPAAEWRILCLGDSQTFGVGLGPDQTWPSILADKLRRHLPRGQAVRVINAGQPGFGAEQGAALLDEVLATYDPQVVVAIFGYDDKNLPVYTGLPVAGRKIFLDPVLDWSATYRWTRRMVARLEERRMEDRAATSFRQPWWERSAANMKIMHDRITARGGHFAMGSEGVRGLSATGSPTEPDRASYESLERAYQDLARQLGVPCLDVNALFRASKVAEQDLFTDDLAVHVSRVGTQLIADALATELWQRGWVPRGEAR